MSLAVLGTLTAAGGKTFAAFFLGSGASGEVDTGYAFRYDFIKIGRGYQF